MNRDLYDEEDRRALEELELERQRKASSFKLNIQDDGYRQYESKTGEELTSYSSEEALEQMTRDSKHALKKKARQEKRAAKAKNKKNRRIFRFIWIVSVIIVGAMAGMFIIAGINDMLAVNRTDAKTVQIEIPENPTVKDVAEVLSDNGVIGEPTYFILFASLTQASDDFTQGTYEIETDMDYEAIINYLLSNANRTDTIKVTITEGESVLEIAETLDEAGAVSDKDEFLALCDSNGFDDDYDFLKDIDNTDERYYKLEGYLYPDTYYFYVNEDPEEVIYRFLNNYESKIYGKQTFEYGDLTVTSTVEELAADSDYTLDEIMTIASIIQAEAADNEDMYYISSILHNRLTADADLGVSSLGLDSTRYYPYRSYDAMPDDIKDSFISTYNTYDFNGLPPGPICNPGMNAIIAALNPYSTGYYYFCHDSDGNAYYASTAYQHSINLEYISDD